MGAAEMNRSGSWASRGSAGRFCSIETIAPAPAKPMAPRARTSSQTSPGMEGLRQHGRSADQHRGQHAGRRAQVEQRHRRPQHLARAEFPCRGDRRGDREQVMPRGGNRFRWSGGARRVEQRSPPRRAPRSCRAHRRQSCRSSALRSESSCTTTLVTASNRSDDLVDAGPALGIGEDHLWPATAAGCAAGSHPCSPR